MSLVMWVLIGLIVLPTAELVFSAAIVALIGLFATFGLAAATSMAGLLVLRRAGRPDTAAKFPAGGHAANHKPGRGGRRLEPVIGGILLLIPGFITDFAGLFMLIGPVRRRLGAKIRRHVDRARRHSAAGPETIDLEQGEWRALPNPEFENRASGRTDR